MICVAASFISGSSEGRNCSSGLAAIKPCTAAATTGAARKGELKHLAVVYRSGSGAANGISAWGCSEKKNDFAVSVEKISTESRLFIPKNLKSFLAVKNQTNRHLPVLAAHLSMNLYRRDARPSKRILSSIWVQACEVVFAQGNIPRLEELKPGYEDHSETAQRIDLDRACRSNLEEEKARTSAPEVQIKKLDLRTEPRSVC